MKLVCNAIVADASALLLVWPIHLHRQIPLKIRTLILETFPQI
jgi:hypothetical protein